MNPVNVKPSLATIHAVRIVNTIILITDFSAETGMSLRYPSTKMEKGALAWYGKITWESAHAWILKILCYLIVWGITLIFMVRLIFYATPLLIYDVMNDIIITP